jgi:heme/copper-type cytochrome/quinol oxidase subunit 4
MNELNLWDVIVGSIVCIMYIVGKVWIYHNHTKDTKDRVIRRGWEWPE